MTRPFTPSVVRSIAAPRRSLRGGMVLPLVLLLVALLLAAAAIAWLNVRGEAPLPSGAPNAADAPADAATLQRGAYLARAGNCAACHTRRGGAAYAGGRGIDTPFGTVFAPNLTPDDETGLGRWSSAEFWRAMHHGRSKDGRLLYPAFPYPSFTAVTREDADALRAYLRRLAPVRQPNTPHALRFPYNLQASLAVWRALYFRPESFEPEPAQSAAWNRGRYLVRGLGHCNACHADRNLLGATRGGIELGGGLIPMQNWYAPPLAAGAQPGVAPWSREELVALLKNGVTARASVMGPMAEVVFRSTQHLSEPDLAAVATYLQSLPPAPRAPQDVAPASPAVMQAGRKLYADQCAGCHGEQGEGVAAIYPALAGNLTLSLALPNNLVKAILHGGFAPATAGNPRPFGMPPFGQSLSDAEVAAVATYVRQSWGHRAAEVSVLDVLRAR